MNNQVFKSAKFTVPYSSITAIDKEQELVFLSGGGCLVFEGVRIDLESLEQNWLHWLGANNEVYPQRLQSEITLEQAEKVLAKALNSKEIATYAKYHANLSTAIADELKAECDGRENNTAFHAATRFLNRFRSGHFFNVMPEEKTETIEIEGGRSIEVKHHTKIKEDFIDWTKRMPYETTEAYVERTKSEAKLYQNLHVKIASCIYDEFQGQANIEDDWLETLSQRTAKRFLSDLVGNGKLKQTLSDEAVKDAYRQSIQNELVKFYSERYPDLYEQPKLAEAVTGVLIDKCLELILK